jgi:hypothetical protein
MRPAVKKKTRRPRRECQEHEEFLKVFFVDLAFFAYKPFISGLDQAVFDCKCPGGAGF